jgi:hypothetical protein
VVSRSSSSVRVFKSRRIGHISRTETMSKCYAYALGGCAGRIEDEHFISAALERMLGTVTVAGLEWQRGGTQEMVPGSYAHSRVLCQRHHDQLDGCDGEALAYFRNLMLIAVGARDASGTPVSREDVTVVINGREVERWFLKMICGAIASGSVRGEAARTVPLQWIQGLFGRIDWPDEWCLYVTTGTRTFRTENARFQLNFVWSDLGTLNGLVAHFFAIETIFSLVPPDVISPEVLRRPKGLGAAIERPGNGDVLVGMPPGEHIRFEIAWPVH